MSTEQMRAEFEVWWSSAMNIQEMDLHRFVDGYACHETNRAWMAWQASRAALAVELPEVEYFGDSWSGGWALRKDDVVEALTDAGIPVKP